MEHIPDETLESYSMRTLSESEAGSLEDHLRICHDCQVRLDAMDEYVAAMRDAAAVRIRQSGEGA